MACPVSKVTGKTKPLALEFNCHPLTRSYQSAGPLTEIQGEHASVLNCPEYSILELVDTSLFDEEGSWRRLSIDGPVLQSEYRTWHDRRNIGLTRRIDI